MLPQAEAARFSRNWSLLSTDAEQGKTGDAVLVPISRASFPVASIENNVVGRVPAHWPHTRIRLS